MFYSEDYDNEIVLLRDLKQKQTNSVAFSPQANYAN
jgi:hypothetical protein